MADFVIVVVAAASLAVAPAATERSAATVQLSAPAAAFTVYRDAASCEAAVDRIAARAGTRLVCVPVEPIALEAASLF